MNDPKSFLPWYINESLSADEKREVERWLAEDEQAARTTRNAQRVVAAINSQPEQAPSRQVEQKLWMQIQQPAPQKSTRFRFVQSLPLAALMFMLIWLLVQPGTQLQWSATGNELAAFRIYRAPADSADFELVSELPANPAQQTYQYADTHIVPGQSYQYVVEAIDLNGSAAARQSTYTHTWMALAAQVAILLASLMLAYGFITLLKEISIIPHFILNSFY